VVVDENDREIGSAPLDEVLEKGLYHRIVSVFVRDEHERILLQLRGPHVKIFPNCWDPAAGGHVDMGNSYEQTALMEAKEELGLRDISLKLLGTHRSNTPEGDRIINEFERAYLVQITHDTPLKPQPEEISALRWFDPAELKREVAANPSKFTSGLLYCLRQYFPSIGL
jgi:isopentenyldiphosphate isomerase